MRHVLVLVGSTDRILDAVTAALRARDRIDVVIAITAPALDTAMEETVTRCAAEGATRLSVLAVEPSLQSLAKQCTAKLVLPPGLELAVLPPPDFDDRWAGYVAEHAEYALSSVKDVDLPPILFIEGLVAEKRSFTRADLETLPQIPDISPHVPGREGTGVWVRDLLDSIGVQQNAATITFDSGDTFSASVDLQVARQSGILAYSRGGRPLSEADGGPVRLYVPGADDRCANVKSIDRITVSA